MKNRLISKAYLPYPANMLIPLNEIEGSISTENPWWETGGISSRLDGMARRTYFDPFYELATQWDVNRAVILLGPRRVGKTVMTQHLIKRLIDDGVPPRCIMYVSIDTPTYTGQSLQFFVEAQERLHLLAREERRYIVFDEIQYFADWERHLKVLVDKNSHIRFIASGSAAAALKLASTESGAGRFTDFMLPPLTFEEYLSFIGRLDLVEYSPPVLEENEDQLEDEEYAEARDIDELNREFVNYVNYGGYPEAVVSPAVRMDAARYIKSDIIEKVLLRDLPQLYGITNVAELNKLFVALAYQTGQEISLESLAQSSNGISKPTITKYIEYLEAAFLIFRLRRIDENAREFTRERTFKVYLTNPSMRAALFAPMTADMDGFGFLVETAILSQWFHSGTMDPLHYARWRRSGKAKTQYGDTAEIDIVATDSSLKPIWLIEVKWSDSAQRKPECWSAIREFVQGKKTVTGGIFTTRTLSGRRKIHGRYFDLVPCATYCYTVGCNVARSRGLDLLRSGQPDDWEAA